MERLSSVGWKLNFHVWGQCLLSEVLLYIIILTSWPVRAREVVRGSTPDQRPRRGTNILSTLPPEYRSADTKIKDSTLTIGLWDSNQ